MTATHDQDDLIKEQTDSFEKLVTAALKVDPKGLSGKHVNEDKVSEATEWMRIEAILLDAGYSQIEANAWRNQTHPKLDGRNPLQVWCPGTETPDNLRVMVREAAEWSAAARH